MAHEINAGEQALEETVNLRIRLANDPNTALVAVVHTMLLQAFYEHTCIRSRLDIELKPQDLIADVCGNGTSDALDMLDEMMAQKTEELPEDAVDLWNWCFIQNHQTLLELLALCTSLSINAVTTDNLLE